MPASERPAAGRTRWSIGAYYLDQPHPERGGYWYACHYDAGARRVHRVSLRTGDFEAAKQALAKLVATTPVRSEDAPHPREVVTLSVLSAYITGHASSTRSEEYAIRVETLVRDYFQAKGLKGVRVADWTPSRQLDFARWLHDAHKHQPSTIERSFNVLSAAFNDAARVKLRVDAFGREIEGSLVSHVPKFVWKEAALRKDLRLPAKKAVTFVPTLDEMARFVDALETEHLKRWALIAMATWARPEAITDFDPYRQWDRRTNLINLDPPGRVQTTKRRAVIVCCRTLQAALEQWMQPRTFDDPRRPAETIERPAPLLYKRQPVGSVKKAIKRIADDIDLPDITQKTMRTFMSTMVRKLCLDIPREKRSAWLGHVVDEGSRTTDFYEIFDADYLADVALATDYVLQQIRSRCRDKTFAIEVRLKTAELRLIGARPIKNSQRLQADDGGRDRD